MRVLLLQFIFTVDYGDGAIAVQRRRYWLYVVMRVVVGVVTVNQRPIVEFGVGFTVATTITILVKVQRVGVTKVIVIILFVIFNLTRVKGLNIIAILVVVALVVARKVGRLPVGGQTFTAAAGAHW